MRQASNVPYGANSREEEAVAEEEEEEELEEEEAEQDHRFHLTSMCLNNPPNQSKT